MAGVLEGLRVIGLIPVISQGHIAAAPPPCLPLIKTLPYLFDIILWDTNTGILHRHKYLLIAYRGLDIDDRILPAEFDGIVNQIVENLLNLAEISVDHLDGIGEGEIKSDSFCTACTFKVSEMMIPRYFWYSSGGIVPSRIASR